MEIFDFSFFDPDIFDTGYNPNPVPVTEWRAEVLVPMSPVIRNEYKRFKFFDRNGNSYHLPPQEDTTLYGD